MLSIQHFFHFNSIFSATFANFIDEIPVSDNFGHFDAFHLKIRPFYARLCKSRCIHENGTKMARIDRKLTESGTNCLKVLLYTKTTSDDVRSLV